MKKFDYSTHISPFTWRYGSSGMRKIFSEENKYRLWRKIWVSLAKAQAAEGLITKKELDDLIEQENSIDIERIQEIEIETHHDVVAAIREFGEKAKVGGGKIHLGSTSMDIVDNADALRVFEALEIIEKKLKKILLELKNKIEKYAKTPCIAYTHLQPAEPTTIGYRFAFYAQDALLDLEMLRLIKGIYKAKGLKGAVGTSASYLVLLNDPGKLEKLESDVMKHLGIPASLVTTQINSRKYDYIVLSLLASICSTMAKFAGDVRILQSPPIGEWSEPFSKKQVGSSAMPFKRNPRMSENICSLARYVSVLPSVMLEDATLSHLERTLDDSGNRRIILPDSFLATDEILDVAGKVLSGLVIYSEKVEHNLFQYGPFAATESILMLSVKKGANRQIMHEVLREIAMKAWENVQHGKENNMEKLLLENKDLKKYLTHEEITSCLDVTHHVGNASERALQLAKEIKKMVKP